MKTLIRHLKTLSADLFWAGRNAADAASFCRLASDFISHRSTRLTRRPLGNAARRVRLRGGALLHYRLNSADIWTIHEVWVEEIYALPIGVKTTTLVDLGANIGLTSLWLARRYGCERIIAVEPNTANAQVARRNLAKNKIAAQVLEAAAGATDGTAIFDDGPGSTNGRIVKSGASTGDSDPDKTQNSRQHEVQVLSMNSVSATLPPETPIDLLKIDIEGGEQNLLSGDLGWLGRVQAIIVEFHPQLVDYPMLVQKLEESGFRRTHKDFVNENSLEIFVR